MMNYETWVAKRNAGYANSAKAKARVAARKAVIEVFEIFPDDWFSSIDLCGLVDVYVDRIMLGDLVKKGVLIAEPYIPGSSIPRSYKFNPKQGG